MPAVLSPIVPPFRRRRRSSGSSVLPIPAAPATPNTPSPTNGATALSRLLSWLSAGATKYDVYLDTVTPPVALVSLHQVDASLQATLLPATTYYWQIVAINDGGSTTGPIWSFTTLAATYVIVTLNGVQVESSCRFDSLSIRDGLNAAPNNLQAVFRSLTPVGGDEILVGLGTLDADDLLFAGIVQEPTETYLGQPSNLNRPVNAVDYTVELNQRRPFGTFVNVSATTVARTILATYAPTFTSTGVQDGLPTVSINFDGSEDFSTALNRLATMVSGYTYLDQRDVHLFDSASIEAVDPLDSTHTFFKVPPISSTRDRSQLRNRVYGKGHGELVPCDVAAGETILPIANAVMFNPVGGQAIAGTTSDGAQTQILSYTGVQLGGAGALIGPGVTPPSAPVAVEAPGSGIESGVHQYAYTYVTSRGETLPSPIATVTHGPITVPTLITAGNVETAFHNSDELQGWDTGDSVEWAYSYGTTAGANLSTTRSPSATVVAIENTDSPGSWYHSSAHLAPKAMAMRVYYSADARVTRIYLWYRVNAGTWRVLNSPLVNFPGSTSINVEFNSPNLISVTGFTPTNPTYNQTTLDGIPIGPTRTTSRNIYRTVVGGTDLKLQQAIANNTATSGVTDATADASLGASVPTGDTSGIVLTDDSSGGFYSTGVSFSTDGAATAANTSTPVFTSATYTFVSGDVGAAVYIKSGTNWTPGRYRIASVAGGAATLASACATVASPTSATWGVDYSEMSAARFVFTDLVIDAVSNVKFTSAAHPTIGVNYIGNVVAIASSVGFIAQRAIVTSATGSAAIVDKSLGTLGSTNGQASLGGTPPSTTLTPRATSIPTASPSPFFASGGWALLSSGEFVRYTGISGNTLTGVPASGPGAIASTVGYGSEIAPVPALTGINQSNGLSRAIASGSAVHLWVERNDLAAQALYGIHEHLISDGRVGETLLTAMCDADLALFSRPIITVRYDTRDPKTRSGKTVHVNLPAPTSLTGDFVIQDVTITFDGPHTMPRYSVSASTVRFSFEDVLRRVLLSS